MKVKIVVYILIFFSIYGPVKAGFWQTLLERFTAIGQKLRTAKEVFTTAALEDDCSIKCPSGFLPIRNLSHIPKANGCGTFGLKIRTGGFFMPAMENWGMQTCCNDHDICYDTCSKDKEVCDRQFLFCLIEFCHLGKEAKIQACEESAVIAAKIVETFGCVSYMYAQKDACVCTR